MLWMEEVSLKNHPRTLFQKTRFCPQINLDENVTFLVYLQVKNLEFWFEKPTKNPFF